MGLTDGFRLFKPELSRNTGFLVGSSVAATLAVVAIARRLVSRAPPKKKTLSPRVTQLLRLSKAEQSELPYPPDVFPGARDVDSPYGTIRVYEWGPEHGRKVLLVHGISTPCLALGAVALGLVEKGCRVILFDLWGRGYSDSVDLPHDSRLYATEILLAITSSPLSWTPEGFSLIGYSLGGGICADFASSFPNLVNGIVLLAPGGLIRPHHFTWKNRLMYSGILPQSLLQSVVRRAQRAEAAASKGFKDESPPLSKSRPDVTVGSVVQWQLNNHQGFVHSFVSSLQNAPVGLTAERRELWKKLGLRKDKVIVIAGSTDPVIVADELRYDAADVIGDIEWRIIEGGHDFPITLPEETVKEICGMWGI